MMSKFGMRRRIWVASCVGMAAIGLAGLALRGQQPSGAPEFSETRAMVPMRDGIMLNTVIFIPKTAARPLPFLIRRTPYGAPADARPLTSESYKELVEEGYIFVVQDIRGRFKSEGIFVMARPVRDRRDPRATDESTDAYDTVGWLLKNVPGNNGRAGIFGISYDGWMAAMALLDPHPALKAASPQASPAVEIFRGDDMYHNGAFRLSYAFEYAAMMEASKTISVFRFDRYDAYEWYLKLGPLAAVNEKYFLGKMPSWNDFVDHPRNDDFWRGKEFLPHLTKVTVPTLSVAGWWDQEDFYGPQRIYEALEARDGESVNSIAIGPWNHGGWMRGSGAALGNIKFGSATAKYFREKIQAPFFARHLKGKGDWRGTEAIVFETGADAWREYDRWPPLALTEERSLYFREDGRLSFEAPASDADPACDEYASDPAHPVPYRPRPIEQTYDVRGSGWPTWLVGDQRFAHLRPDVLSWETEPLAEDVTIAGRISARLFASTTGTDSDWVVKLIDVFPDDAREGTMGGYQLMIAGDILRSRFRNGFEKPERLEANTVTGLTIDLLAADHAFRRGHKIMVQVQSTWFPLIDRNPQTFVENIFFAKASDFRPATQRIFRAKSRPSHIVLPVKKR